MTDAERQAARAEPALAALPRRRESLPEDLRRLVMSHADGREATSPYQIIAPELPTTAAFEIARRRDQLILVFNTATRFTAICTARCPMKHSLFKCAPFLRAAFVFRLEQAEFDECVTGPLDTQMENCHQPGAGRRFDMACGVIDKRAARAGESNRSGGLMEHPASGFASPTSDELTIASKAFVRPAAARSSARRVVAFVSKATGHVRRTSR